MNLDGGHSEVPSTSEGHDLSATSEDASPSKDYALMTEEQIPKPSLQHPTMSRSEIASSKSSQLPPTPRATNKITRFDDISSFESGLVEGFLLSKHPCAPSHHLYHRFQQFPRWNPKILPGKPPESRLLSFIDDELWNEFSHAFTNDLNMGNRNIRIFQLIVGLVTIGMIWIVPDEYDSPLWLMGFIIVIAVLYECLRPSLFDKIDRTTASFYSRFAEKGLKISVVYYTIKKGRLSSTSRYLVFKALPHPLTLNLV